MNTPKVAVILAGSGNLDGNNIIETIALLRAIVHHGGSYVCFAPDMEMHEVVNHLSGDATPERRNVWVESARMVQGDVRNLEDFKAEDFHALAIPGGLGVIKNLCTYALAGSCCTVNPLVEKAIITMHKNRRPIAALCIAPVLIARVLGKITVTLGSDCSQVQDIQSFGTEHQESQADEFITDEDNLIFTSPCYMLPNDVNTVCNTVDALVEKMFQFIK